MLTTYSVNVLHTPHPAQEAAKKNFFKGKMNSILFLFGFFFFFFKFLAEHGECEAK